MLFSNSPQPRIAASTSTRSVESFIRSHNEALSIALRIKNPGCSPFKATIFPRNLALAFTHYLSERPEMSQNKRTMMEGKNLMKNITLMICLIAALAIFTLPADAARRVNQSIPITLSVPVPCVGEVVDLSGTLHTATKFRRGSARNSAGVSLYVNTQGVAGTGEITGRGYQANGNINIPFNMFLLNGASNVTTRTEFIEVTSAPGLDGSVISFWLQGDLHLTFHANGTVTVKFDNFTVDCSGNGAGLWDY
jgi:hypothetical protein